MKLQVEDDAKFGNVDGFSHRVRVQLIPAWLGNEVYISTVQLHV